MPSKPRVRAPVYVETVPSVICDAEGVLITNQLGDEIHSWRLSRHKALGVAANISAAVALYERRKKRGEVVPFKCGDDAMAEHG